MSLNLSKNQQINLNQTAQNLGIQGLTNVAIGLGWDCNQNDSGRAFDLDAWAVVVDSIGQTIKRNTVYFGNKMDKSGNIKHMGDNLTGEGEGDDETIIMNIKDLPVDYKYILIGVTIYDGKRKHQTFGDVKNTFIRIYDANTGREICKYQNEFSNELSEYSSMLFGVLNRIDDEQWEFIAVGKGEKFGTMDKARDTYRGYTLPNIGNDQSNIATNKSNQESGGTKFMAVSLSKGGKVSLAKVAADAGISKLTTVVAGLGWDANAYDTGGDFDLDASVFMTGSNNKCPSENEFIFYNNLKHSSGSVEHMGDNRTGSGDGDDEQIRIQLDQVPANIEHIAFAVTIDQAEQRSQNFGMVQNAYIRIFDEVSGTELLRYDLTEDFSIETAIVAGELYKNNGEWKFNAIGAGWQGGLAALCGNYGIQV